MERIGNIMDRMKKKAGVEVLEEKECQQCGGLIQVIRFKNGYVYDDCFQCQKQAEEKQISRNMEGLRRKKRHAKFERISEIPEEIVGETFDDYEPTTEKQQIAKNKAIQYANGECEEKSLVFQGTCGTGKTHLSYCISEVYKQNDKHVIFMDSPRLFALIKSTFNYNDTGLSQEIILETIKQADLLVLDDIGAEYVKPDKNGHESWAADIIYQILNSRLGKQNIYTTNYESKDLQQKYGRLSRRIISRMMNKATALEFDGKDQRIGGFK